MEQLGIGEEDGNEEELGRWPSEERASFQTEMHILSHEVWGEMGDSEVRNFPWLGWSARQRVPGSWRERKWSIY